MKHLLRAVASCSLMLLNVGQAVADELYIYPAKGQSAEQLDKDKYECYSWAKKDTGFDPMALPTTEAAPPRDKQQSGGVVKGALGGAVLGAVIGDSSQATKRGAAAGGLIGGVRQSRKNSANEQERADWESKETANYTNNRSNYNRANAACLEGRGYTVK